MSARYSDCDGINYEGQLRLSRFAREVPADYFLHVASAGRYLVNKEIERREKVEARFPWSWVLGAVLAAVWFSTVR